MTYAPPPPEWVPGGARPSGGRDFLGLRTAAERIGYALMDGVTTVTPHVRYLSLRTWMLHRYWVQERPDSRSDFQEYARQMEAALVVGNLLAGRQRLFLVGADSAVQRIEEEGEDISLSALVRNPAAGIYAGATLSFGLDVEMDGRQLRGPSAPCGQSLAELIDQTARGTDLGRLLSEEGPPDTASRDQLRQLGEVLHLDQISDGEQELLLALLFPEPRSDQERRRLGSNCLALAIADQIGGLPGEHHVLELALAGGRELPVALFPALDGWALFCVRDALVAGHEAVMRSVTRILADDQAQGWKPQDVVGQLLSDSGEFRRVLEEIGLVLPALADATWPDLVAAVKDACKVGQWTRSGLLRWEDGLDERTLGNRCLNKSHADPLALLPVIWALVLLRVSPGRAAAELPPLFEHLESSWLRLSEVERRAGQWSREETPLAEVFSELVILTVEGHLDVAWARIQDNPRSDGLFLLSDGLEWRWRAEFNADHSASRIDRQMGWLIQLGVVDGDGLTALGRETLERGLERLS